MSWHNTMAETVGSLWDKLTVARLRARALHDQMQGAELEHLQDCGERLAVVDEQSSDLACELEWLLSGVLSGRVRMKVYRQHKLYNDERFRR